MQIPSGPTRILLVDDEPVVRNVIRSFLLSGGYAVEDVSSAEEGLHRLESQAFDLVLTDNTMRPMSGAELAVAVKAQHPSLPVVMLSGNPPHQPIPGVDLVLNKPGDISRLLTAVREVLAARPACPVAS
jgi:CheY-like chemotaxis protein